LRTSSGIKKPHNAKTIKQPIIIKKVVLLKPIVLMAKTEAANTAIANDSVGVELNFNFIWQLPHTSLFLAYFDHIFIAVLPHAGHLLIFMTHLY